MVTTQEKQKKKSKLEGKVNLDSGLEVSLISELNEKKSVSIEKSSEVNLQEKVRNIYTKIKEDFYLCSDDFYSNGEGFNSSLLFGVLTEISRGKMLVFGEYGGGKTTSCEYLHSIFNGLPLDFVRRTVIRGNPQLTEEKMVGRPNYGKMHSGQEEVVWQHFVLVGPKIFDEFNRLPEANQSVVLNGVDRGEWNYLNDSIFTKKQPFFATCNYADKGNNDLIPPILDRFDIAVESKFPGIFNSLSIAEDYHGSKEDLLINSDLTQRAVKILNSGKSYCEIQNGLESIVQEYQIQLREAGINGLSNDEKQKINEEIKEIPFDLDSQVYFSFLISEINLSSNFGQKRSTDPLSSKNGLYLQSLFKGSGSRREEKALVKYAKSLAWLQKSDSVNLDHVLQVAPYVYWHRLAWDSELRESFKEKSRVDPLDLHLTKTFFSEGTREIPGVKSRFIESKENYSNVLHLISKGKNEEALDLTTKCYNLGKGHPVFQDLCRELSSIIK